MDSKRSSRAKSKHSSEKLSAFEKLKLLKSKGCKNKVDLEEVENVYDIVTEEEYSKRVNERLDDDWIVDDGTGYVDDGTEIFDDDVEENVSKKKKSMEMKENPTKNGQIKKFFLNAPSKKRKIEDAKLDCDDMLDEVLNELDQEKQEDVPRPLKFKCRSTSESPHVMSKSLIVPAFKKKFIPPKIKNEIVASPNLDENMDASSDIMENESPVNDIEMFTADTNDFIDDSLPEESLDAESNQSSSVKTSEPIIDDWTWSLPASIQSVPPSKDIIIDSSKLPLETDGDDKLLLFYWIDAYEDFLNHPGIVYLFGKVFLKENNAFVSCCIMVKNIERRIFLLPREQNQCTSEAVTMCDVYNEFNQKASSKLKILQFKSRKVTKSYCFGLSDVPKSSDYLEIRYSCQYPMLPPDFTGTTFSHVFGIHTTSLELLILDLKLKGPCWLNIKNPLVSNPKVSWCKLEAVITTSQSISVSDACQPSPPLSVMVFNIQLMTNMNTRQSEILAIGCLVQDEVSLESNNSQPSLQNFIAVTKPSDKAWPWDMKQHLAKTQLKFTKCDSERSLLNFFLAKVQKTDPDLIIGFNIHSADLDVLLHRLIINKVTNWSCIGRLRRSGLPKLHSMRSGKLERSFMSGRLICDAKLSAKELIRAKSYELQSLCSQVLKIDEKEAVDSVCEDFDLCYDSSAKLVTALIKTLSSAYNIYRIVMELNVLPLALQITNIAGNLLSQTLLGGRSLRNEYLLLHAFNEKGYILPDRNKSKSSDVENEEGDKKSSRRKPAYTGGLVLDPKVGFYDSYIILMDFNSLYPSIIQEYNICYTTVESGMKEQSSSEEYIPPIPDRDLPFGVLPTEIRKLVESRQHVKSLLKNGNLTPEQKNQYDIRQKALKLTANSMYGCLGFTNSRFYCKPMAALVTAKGREILMQTRELVQKMNLDVIYGDTDSIMINSNCVEYEDVWKTGLRVKQEVNKLYKCLELDIDGLFRYMLLLKKKKYAALVVEKVEPDGAFRFTQELKGLDIVRRDWSKISAECGRYVVNQILSNLPLDEKLFNIQQHLRELQDKLRRGNVPIEFLTIIKQLTKNPEEYSDPKSQPHVQVALRLNSHSNRKLKHGDTVSYIICLDGSDASATQRAYSLQELKTNDKLSVDVNYYLAHQIHPVVSRLCEPIEGIDNVTIADCLGLDPSAYQKSFHHRLEDDVIIGNNEVSDTERFRQCDKLTLLCPSCRNKNTIDDVFKSNSQGKELLLSLTVCDNPECQVSPLSGLPNIINQLTLLMRKYISQYYEGWLICEDPTCPNRSKRIPSMFSLGYPVCNLCHKGVMCLEYSHSQLYNQLCYYQYIFDVERGYSKLSETEKLKLKGYKDSDIRQCYDRLMIHIRKQLDSSAFSSIDLGLLFKGIYVSDRYNKRNV